MQITHAISPDLLSRRALKVLVVGCGGTGSAIAMGLPYLHACDRVRRS
jgi:molybdopterin/thiamine biosynthesis adenylyltransferase